jgi:predicted RNase H-like nuclease (RuvC/YqgF family)
VNEAVRNVKGKRNHDTITVGVDPGKTFGMAALSNGNVLETMVHSSIERTVNAVLEVLTKNPAAAYIIKVGDGAPEYTRVLLSKLDEALPKEVSIEIVSEAGTSHFAKEAVHRRGLRDAMSAIKIAERRGRPFRRGKGKQQ